MGHPSPKHPAEFKQQAVRPYRGRGGTYAEMARELGCDAGGISDWVKGADAAQASPEDSPFKVAGENRRLRREVERLRRENGRAGATRGCARRPKGERKAAAPQADAASDLVRRDFSADGPDRARFADITCARAHQGWPCLAAVMDIRSRMVVGWPMSDRMGAEPADDALKTAIARRRPGKGCAHHGDHGSQYASLLPGGTMRDAGIEPSMGSISSPWDNAAMGSLMGPIRAGCVHARTFEARERASLEIFECIGLSTTGSGSARRWGTSARRSSRRGIGRAPP